MRFLVGSKLLGLTNNKDVDYLNICDCRKHEYINNCDEFFITLEILNDILHFKPVQSMGRLNNLLRMLWNYQLDYRIINQNFPIKYNIFEYKRELIQLLTYIVEKKRLNFNKNMGNYCYHQLYHFAYNLFILENNSVELTPEQFEIVQKIHDEKMPISYLDEMEKLLEEIKKREAL